MQGKVVFAIFIIEGNNTYLDQSFEKLDDALQYIDDIKNDPKFLKEGTQVSIHKLVENVE